MSTMEEKILNLQTKLEEMANMDGISAVESLIAKNKWIGGIRFAVEYIYEGITLSWNSNEFTKGTQKKVPILEGASEIRLSCDFYMKVGTVIDQWIQLFKMNFAAPVTETYMVYGTTLPKYEQLPH